MGDVIGVLFCRGAETPASVKEVSDSFSQCGGRVGNTSRGDWYFRQSRDGHERHRVLLNESGRILAVDDRNRTAQRHVQGRLLTLDALIKPAP